MISSMPIKAEDNNTPIIPPAADFSSLRLATAAQVTSISSPLRLMIDHDTIVQLSGIHIPDLTPYDAGPIALEAQNFLQERLLNKQIRLYQPKDQNAVLQNRMGHMLAHIEIKHDPLWVQGFLIRNGLAQILPSADNIAMAQEMLALEQMAREEKRGLWALDDYAALTADSAEQGLNRWAVVTGKIHSSAMINNVTYLNFGQDWRSDFTIGIASDIRRKISQSGVNLQMLNGKTIRVHGWIESYNGPYIKLTAPQWLEILDEIDDADGVKENDAP